MTASARGRDPWRKAPTGELGDQVLPRWFVLIVVMLIPVAATVVVVALVLGGPRQLAVAERRPPPAGGYTNRAGEITPAVGEPVVYERACPMLQGVRIAGSDRQRSVLRAGLAALCNVDLSDEVAARLRAFAEARGVVRFARFELTGVDSTATLGSGREPPVVYLNAKFEAGNPLRVAPLIAHDVSLSQLDAASAEAALAARRVEAAVCHRLFDAAELGRGCRDARGLLELDDPLRALRDAGFR